MQAEAKTEGFEGVDENHKVVENPFKNPEMHSGKIGEMKVDPARILGPRLNGVNLYFVGMMGSGKTSIAEVVARRTYTN